MNVIEAAKAAGWRKHPSRAPADNSQDGGMTEKALERFAQIIRNQALEDAAKRCDGLHHGWRWDDEPDSSSGPRDCARSIRSMKKDQTNG